MLDREFGLKVLFSQEPKALDELLAWAKPIPSIEAQILMMEAYDTTYGLYNHDYDRPDEPLALVSLHPGEDLYSGSRMVNLIRQFRKHKVHTHFNLSLQEFLEQPRHINKMILDECLRGEREEYEKTQHLFNNLDDPKKGKP